MELGLLTTVEEIEGHDCSLQTRRVEDEVLAGAYGVRRRTGIQRLIQKIRRSWLPSRKHPYTKYVFKSTTALSREIIRHAEIDLSTIHPFSVFRSNWEIFMTVVYLITFLVFPFVVAFVNKDVEGYEGFDFWGKIIIVIFIITLLDIMVSFRSGYVTRNSKEIVLKRNRITRRYIFSYFIFDIVSSFPYDYVFIHHLKFPMEYHRLSYLNLLKFVRIGSLYIYSRQMLERLKASYLTERVITTICTMIIFLNGMSCLYTEKTSESQPNSAFPYYVHSIAKSEQRQFRQADTDPSKPTIGQRWCHQVVIAVANLIGCNMELQLGQTMEELMIHIFIAIAGLFILIYTGAQVVIITRIINSSTSHYEMMQRQLKEYIKYKQIPPALERRLIEYSKFFHMKTYLKEKLTLEFLSSRLRQEVLLHNCNRLIDQMPFLHHMPPRVITKVVVCLTPEVVLANDVVMKSGMHGDCMYFISSGTVAVFSPSGKEVCHLTDGAHFGEIALVVKNDTRMASIVAVEPTELYTLTRADFLRAVAPYPELLNRVIETAKTRMSFIRTFENQEKNKEAWLQAAPRFAQAGDKKGPGTPSPGLSVSQVAGRNSLLQHRNEESLKESVAEASSAEVVHASDASAATSDRGRPSLTQPPARRVSLSEPQNLTRSYSDHSLLKPHSRYVPPLPASLSVLNLLPPEENVRYRRAPGEVAQSMAGPSMGSQTILSTQQHTKQMQDSSQTRTLSSTHGSPSSSNESFTEISTYSIPSSRSALI